MKKVLLITLGLLCHMALASAQNEASVFLDWRIDYTVSLYDKPGGEIQRRLCIDDTNFEDSMLMMTIFDMNDSMYKVAIGCHPLYIDTGWISKSAPLRVDDRLYSDEARLEVFRSPNGKTPIVTVAYAAVEDHLQVVEASLHNRGFKSRIKEGTAFFDGPFEVVDVNLHNGWLKIRFKVCTTTIEGWIAPGSYCGNPYTDCC